MTTATEKRRRSSLNKLNANEYKKVIKEVHIDDRENSRADLNPSIQRLKYGDYVFFGNNGESIGVEFKTGEDFLSSIDPSTNHLHNQVYNMIHEFDYTFVIIECENLSKVATKRFYQTGINVSIQQINGVISELNTVSTVLFSQTSFQTADLLMRTAGKMIQQKPFLWKFGKKSPNSALNYLNSIHGLKNTAVDIVETLNLRTWKDLDNLTVKDLMKVDGIGKVKAMNIINEIR